MGGKCNGFIPLSVHEFLPIKRINEVVNVKSYCYYFSSLPTL